MSMARPGGLGVGGCRCGRREHRLNPEEAGRAPPGWSGSTEQLLISLANGHTRWFMSDAIRTQRRTRPASHGVGSAQITQTPCSPHKATHRDLGNDSKTPHAQRTPHTLMCLEMEGYST